MEIRQLELFVALAEEGSFTRAGQRMHIVQSGISISIKELERELGTQLVSRTTRKVALTEAGQLFLEHARTSLVALGDGVQAVRSLDGVVRGRLRLGILQSLTPYVQLPLLLQRFRSLYPRIEFEARALQTEAIPRMVRSGQVDLSFQAIVDREHWPGLQVIPYAQDVLVAIASRKHPLAAKKSVALEILSGETCVDLTPDRALRTLVDSVFAARQLRRQVVYQVSDVQTMLEFVAHGLGVAVVPSALARLSPISSRLHFLRIASQGPDLPKWRIAIIARAPSRPLPGKTTVELFLQMLSQVPRPRKAAGY
jgi:DNA-binding transcriptional LysR family regulator